MRLLRRHKTAPRNDTQAHIRHSQVGRLRGRAFSLAIACVLIIAVCCGLWAGEAKRSGVLGRASPTLNDAFAALSRTTIPDGRLFAPFYAYVIGPHAVVARGKVYCVFQNAVGQPIAMAYDSQEKQWSGPVKVSQLGLKNDDHGNPALCIDNAGYLRVFFGCHGGPMRHARSEKPYDISAWREQPSPVPKATYPQVMRMADGSILLFYRAGGHMEPWTMRSSPDNCATWSEPRPIIEMRKAPPDPLAAAYCDFMPGSDGRTVHCFWNHKDDNAARVTPQRPHPWRALKYPGLHEAVYRYNVYYVRRDPDGVWRNGQGQMANLPISKTEADSNCLVYDSGDEFTMLGLRMAVDANDQPYIGFGTGVVDWVKRGADARTQPIVPTTERFATLASGVWRVTEEMPGSWPSDVARAMKAPGCLAYGSEWPAGHWFIFAGRAGVSSEHGCSVHLYNDLTGYATRPGGPASVE
ncbi:BNR-4 repeat-containing protein [Candidatus Sumerlaeota bacterium]|nr:BNR-4 repeat-containing protein [Candidatus Sumerlaeota bacterium]